MIELLIVITMLGVLAATVVFSVAAFGDSGKVAACQADTQAIQTAEDTVYLHGGAYLTMAGLVTAGLLETASTMHDVSLNGAMYVITPLVAPGATTAACADG